MYEYVHNINISHYTIPFLFVKAPIIVVKPFCPFDDPNFIIDYDNTISTEYATYVYVDWNDRNISYIPLNSINTVLYIKYIKNNDNYKSDGKIYETYSSVTS